MTKKVLDLATGAVDGATLTGTGTAGSGGSTGASGVNTTSPSTLEYDDDLAAAAELSQIWSLKVNASTTSGVTFITDQGFSSTALGVEGYYYYTDSASALNSVMWAGNNITRGFQVNINTTGKLQLMNSANTAVWTSTQNFPLNDLTRIEVFATQGAGTGTLRIAFYNGQAATAIEDSGTLTAQQTGSVVFNTIRWGKTTTSAYGSPFWIMGLAYDPAAAGLLGPLIYSSSSLQVGSGTATAAYVGGTAVSKMFLGSTQVFG